MLCLLVPGTLCYCKDKNIVLESLNLLFTNEVDLFIFFLCWFSMMTVEAQSDELVLLWSLTCLYYLSVSQARCILCTSRSWCGDTWYRMGVVEGKICFKIYILKGWIHQVCFSFNIQSETPGPVWLLQIWDSYWYFGRNNTSDLLMSSFIPKFWNSCLPNKP